MHIYVCNIAQAGEDEKKDKRANRKRGRDEDAALPSYAAACKGTQFTRFTGTKVQILTFMGVTALSSALESASKLHAKANAIVLSAEAKTDKCASVKVQKLLAHADRMHTLATDIRYTHI